MSNAMKINKKGDKKSNKPTVSQSIPVHFYKNYIPPKTPKINPMQPPQIPDFDQLPKISPTVKTSISGSMTNKYPMSMPARSGLMGPSTTPFQVAKPSSNTNKKEEEEKNEPNSLEEETKKLKIGSFTCLDVMRSNSPLKRLEEAPLDNTKDNVSVQTNSTFASGGDENDIASDGDEDDDDAVFDMDM